MKTHIDKFFAAIVAFMGWQVYQYWLDRRGYLDLLNVATSQEVRPFVYRVLVPLLSRMLSWLIHSSATDAMVIVLICFSIVMYYSIKQLYESFVRDGRGPVVSFVGCLAMFVIMIQESKVYDIPTAAFFALCLAYLARGKFLYFYIAFPFATLNRETTFLLTAFYALYYFNGPISRRHWFFGCLYQVLVYVVIRLGTMAYFAEWPGAAFIISLKTSLYIYGMHYLLTSAYLICLAGILYLTLRRWDQKPGLLRTAFLIIFPIQVALHFLLGWAYELRVYAESIPILAVLIMIPTVPNRKVNSNKFPPDTSSLCAVDLEDKPEHH